MSTVSDAPVVDVVIVRDPDAGTEVAVFVRGEEVAFNKYVIDAGAGYMWDQWVEMRDEVLNETAGALHDTLRVAYSDPPGGGYVEGREGRNWLTGTAEDDE